jgi:gluconate 2-dehydrogenase gamma chain
MDSPFDPHQRATIEAAAARIIPTDQDPGAAEAGVIEYIERTLGGYAGHAAAIYKEGARELDRRARDDFVARDFISLKAADQDRILAGLERAKSPFFGILLEHAMEGFYGDPRHGGNKNRVGWKLLGFPGPSFPNGYRSPLGGYDANEPNDFGSAKKR